MRHRCQLNSAKRRTRKEHLAREHGQCCAYCRRPFTDLRDATLDHIVPHALCRSWTYTALMLACFDCNQAKADRFPLSIALLYLAWTDPTAPVVPPTALPLLARLAHANQPADPWPHDRGKDRCMSASRTPPGDPRAALRGGLPDRYLTPEDLVTMFSLPSVETVYAWRRKRIGPPGFRVGKYLRFNPTAVRAWETERTALDDTA